MSRIEGEFLTDARLFLKVCFGECHELGSVSLAALLQELRNQSSPTGLMAGSYA